MSQTTALCPVSRSSPRASGARHTSGENLSYRRWKLAAATIAASISPGATFQIPSEHPPSRRVSSFSNPLPHVRTASSSTRRWTMTDPDMLLIELNNRPRMTRKGPAVSESVESLEKLYVVSSDMKEISLRDHFEVATRPTSSLPPRKKKHASQGRSAVGSTSTRSTASPGRSQPENPNAVISKVQFKTLTSSSRKKNRKLSMAAEKESDKKKPTAKSRSSTMPGFSHQNMTGKRREFRDGLKLVESRTGKKMTKILNDPEARKKRKQINGETMYRECASVPDSLVQFANEIHMVERITPSDEVELGTKTQEAIRLQSLYENLEEKLEREPTDDEWCAAAGKINMESIRQAIEDGLEAKDRLVTSNLRMVQGVVNIYIRNGLGGQYNAGDMMQEGIIALIRAAEKFEPERGFRFSTYAMYWIRAAVKRSHILQSRVINVPQRLHENHRRVLRVEKELKSSLKRNPTRKELGEAVGMSEQQLDRCRTAMAQRCYSLDAEVSNKLNPDNGDVNKNTMNELIDSRTDNGDYDKVQQIFLREDLIETLNRHLSPDKVDLLLLRFGLMDEDAAPPGISGPLTLAQVSNLVGLKPDKVRRMINRCLKELKYLIANEWDDFERQLHRIE